VIVSQYGENLDAFRERNVRAARTAYGKFALARSAAVPQIFHDFNAESFHRRPAFKSSSFILIVPDEHRVYAKA
jgi:hypothetical protein